MSQRLTWDCSGADPERHAFVQETEEERFRLEASLARHLDNAECLTVASITSEETVALGADLNPANYNNLWMAGKTVSTFGKQLIQCNTGCRVLDGENIGYSYGREVLKRRRTADGRTDGRRTRTGR